MENAHRGEVFGKPRRAISHFRHQDAQTPPSPRVGEGGRGDEGQKRKGDSGMLANWSSGYPARSHRRGAPSGGKCLQMPALIV